LPRVFDELVASKFALTSDDRGKADLTQAPDHRWL
jgi:hypothetical protein